MDEKITPITQASTPELDQLQKEEKTTNIELTPKKKNERENIPRKYLRSRWKHFLSQDNLGDLLIEGVNIKEIIKKYGSPLYVIVEEEIREKCRKFKEGIE
jgi:hypothetical protein